MRSNSATGRVGAKIVFKPADNYLKLTVRTERTVRDYLRPFRSEFEAEAAEAYSDLLGIQLSLKTSIAHASFSISAFDPRPLRLMGEHLPTIGDFNLQADEPAPLH